MRGPDPCVCQGSVRNLVSSAGAITDTYINTAFGVELLTSGSTINPFRYVGLYGYYRDMPELMQVRARWLAANQGNWLSTDTLWVDTHGSRYTYVEQNPEYYVDPSGWQGEAQPKPITTSPPEEYPLRIVRGGLGQAPEAGFGPWFGFITKSCLTIGLLTQAIPAGPRRHNKEDRCASKYPGLKPANTYYHGDGYPTTFYNIEPNCNNTIDQAAALVRRELGLGKISRKRDPAYEGPCPGTSSHHVMLFDESNEKVATVVCCETCDDEPEQKFAQRGCKCAIMDPYKDENGRRIFW